MNLDAALDAVAEADATDLADRAARLVELSEQLDDGDVGFSGEGARWLFDDVKATWIYGHFTATVLAAYAFCLQQLSGLLRWLPDDPELPESTTSLEELAAAAQQRGVIELDLRARLVTLNDIARIYASANLHEYRAEAERRAIEAEDFSEEHSLLTDARLALECSLAVLHRRS